MEFVQRDVACCGREEEWQRPANMLVCYQTRAALRCQATGPMLTRTDVLHHHKNHGMTENGEEQGKEKTIGSTVAEQGNVFDRDIETSVNQIARSLNIIGEVEASILENPPSARKRSVSDKEENDGEGCDNNVARCSLVIFAHSWLGRRN